jgi:NADPH:quinone reductase-like Zn-dependent oxidoreductase
MGEKCDSGGNRAASPDIGGGGQQCTRWEPRGRGENRGKLASAHARPCALQSHGPFPDPAIGRFRSVGRSHAKSGASGMPFRMPFVPGIALSGTVASVGLGASGYAVGDEVFGSSEFGRSGSYAEYTTSKPGLVAAKPRSLDHIHAAAVPVSALAAWQALFGEGMIDPKPGQTILIHGAAGGVGSFAAQLAKWRGARVIGTGSSKNEGFLREHGVDQFIDYTKQSFDEVVHDIDAVLDTIGGDVEKRSWRVLKPGGVLASVVARQLSPPQDAAPNVRGAPVNGGLATWI